MDLKFKCSKDEHSPEVEISITYPTYDEALEARKRTCYYKAFAGSTLRVDVQGDLRKAMKAGLQGKALKEHAQDCLMKRLDNKPVAEPHLPVDTKVIAFSDEQIAYLKSLGNTVI